MSGAGGLDRQAVTMPAATIAVAGPYHPLLSFAALLDILVKLSRRSLKAVPKAGLRGSTWK
jgi:hypothetical protein